MTPRNRMVTVFSSIQQIASSIRKAAPEVPLNEIFDDALTGYGGTVTFDPKSLKPSTKEELASAQILITEPAVLAAILQHDPSAFPKLQWCQSTYAGIDPMFKTPGINMPLPFTMTRFAGKFGPPIAEWTMARIIGHERQFALTAQDQKEKAWAGSGPKVTTYRYLSDLTLVILGGCGDIGSCIGRAAKAFGMRVIAFSKTPRNNNKLPQGIDECSTDLKDVLIQADYLVSVLPSTGDTQGLLSGEALAPCSSEQGGKCPAFLNVGRGDVIDESNLISALDRGYISAAILDVFETEPLPKESALWERPDVIVSPHVSGVTRAQDVPDLFLDNYKRYVEGKDLQFVVDWNKGY